MPGPDRKLRLWLFGSGSGYALGAAGYALRPRSPVSALNRTGGAPIEPEQPLGLYHSLAIAYMATIAALALSAAADVRRNHPLIPALLVAKAASSAALLCRYLVTRRRGFAAAAALDAALLAITGGLYVATDRARL